MICFCIFLLVFGILFLFGFLISSFVMEKMRNEMELKDDFKMEKMRDDLKYVFEKMDWDVEFYDTCEPTELKKYKIEDEIVKERMERIEKTIDALFDELGYEFKEKRNVVVKKKK